MESKYDEWSIVKDFINCNKHNCTNCECSKNVKGFNNSELDLCVLLSTYADTIADAITEQIRGVFYGK